MPEVTNRQLQRHSRQLARFCAICAREKKCDNIVAIDISSIDGAPANWFVVVTCSSTQQVRAVAEHIEEQTTRAGVMRPRSEGWEALQWVILDYFDVVIHVMHHDARTFYKLEKLWGDGVFYTLTVDGRLLRQ